jgi:hypothetical protein
VLDPGALRRENVLATASTSLMRTDRHLEGKSDAPFAWDIGLGRPKCVCYSCGLQGAHDPRPIVVHHVALISTAWLVTSGS